MSAEMKACPNPWCGDHIYCAYNRPPLWRVVCGCGVKGPCAYTEAEAIAAWNTRPDRDQVLEEAAGWQPIETAPKDGTWILVWLGGMSDCADTIQWAYGDWWNGSSGHVRSECPPTHWRPLPAPPAKAPQS